MKTLNVLIIPPFGLGDAILSTPAIRALKQYTHSRITQLTMKSSIFEILKNNPFIDELIFEPILEQSMFKTLKFIATRLNNRFDVSITFYPANRKDYNIFSLLINAHIRVGHSYMHNNISQMHFLKNRNIRENESLHVVEENFNLLTFFGIKIENIKNRKPEVYLDDKEIEYGYKFLKPFRNSINIGIHAGSSTFKNHNKRRWPKEKFVSLINSLSRFNFFLFGGKDEYYENDFIFTHTKNSHIIQQDSIRKAASIMRHLDLFVSNDSGLMHLASALNIPTVAIFGPTNPVFAHPWNTNSKVIRLNLKCSPCFYYSPKPLHCRLQETFKCLKDLNHTIVQSAILDLLSNKNDRIYTKL